MTWDGRTERRHGTEARLDRLEAAIDRIVTAQERAEQLQRDLHTKADEHDATADTRIRSIESALNIIAGGDISDTKNILTLRANLEAADRINEGLKALGGSIIKGIVVLSFTAVASVAVANWQAVKAFVGFLR